MNKFEFDVATLAELVPATTEKLGLSHPMVVDKDVYVTKAISIISEINNQYFDLVFKGGSCLAKIGIIKRMSEDCDYRIVTKAGVSFNSKNARRNCLRKLRTEIIAALEAADYVIDESIAVVQSWGDDVYRELSCKSHE